MKVNKMNTFANAVINQSTVTTNGMPARSSTADACVDLFFKIGASRGKDIIPDFVAAYSQQPETALRIAAWARDVRGGAGERELFRQILKYLEKANMKDAIRLMSKTPNWGRWDDILIFESDLLKQISFEMVKRALASDDGLCAKWMPRKGEVANSLRNYLDWSPKFYRKRLVELTKVVETQMCANQWDDINFSHVPSIAAARYKKAFNRHTTKYADYVSALASGEAGVKVNAAAIYPHEVIKGVGTTGLHLDETERKLVIAQWDALENFVGDKNVLPMIDVSGSMTCRVGGNSKSSVTCLDVAVALGLYVADKCTGKFKDTFLTFSSKPKLQHVKGDIIQKIEQTVRANWEMSTNISGAMDEILRVAREGNVSQAEMPQILLIMSDMQFDYCAKTSSGALDMTRQKFAEAGYEMPKVVFWNLNAHSNVPVAFNEVGAALVSGFSPSILKSVLSGDLATFTPETIMWEAIGNDRYDM